MAMHGSTDRSAKAQERYVLRPVALCCVLAAGGVLLLLLGLRLVMAIRGVRLVLGLALLVGSGLLFVGVYLLGRCAVIVDGQGIRIREAVGGWRQMRWSEAVSVSRKHVPRSGRSGGYTMLVITTCEKETFELIENERTRALVIQYGPGIS